MVFYHAAVDTEPAAAVVADTAAHTGDEVVLSTLAGVDTVTHAEVAMVADTDNLAAAAAAAVVRSADGHKSDVTAAEMTAEGRVDAAAAPAAAFHTASTASHTETLVGQYEAPAA